MGCRRDIIVVQNYGYVSMEVHLYSKPSSKQTGNALFNHKCEECNSNQIYRYDRLYELYDAAVKWGCLV